MQKLATLLENNQIDVKEFELLLTQTLLLTLFEKICNDFKEDLSKKTEFLNTIRSSNNEPIIIKNYCYKHYNVSLDLEYATLLYTWILCFFRKKPSRLTYPIEVKEQLLKQQEYSCKCCNKKMSIANSHLDHIIPWTYVGDELADNLQMLCTDCNSSKNKSISYLLLNCIMRKKEAYIA
ncbi:HNH endonuclease [Bacillus cereus]|uniref:HNH endonuclease n=1 Tax=Bacillus cereus TaxID=1396 RepID=UPI000BF41CF5|nr:HNH endonuclease [Bacillus cereus]PFS47135.1 hypothetical protein COK44_17355 [Bacillus cereus]